MNKLSNFLVEQMLLEDKSPIKKVVVIYGGRFQPFHKGHYGTYSHLVKKFGKDNVFISTSNKVEKPKSPFNYKEKVKIISTMFNIPKSKIVQVKNNYAPTEILKKYDKNTTAFITVVGEKDAGRLGGKYFQPWKGKAEVGYEDGGYVYAAPSSGGGISGTETRNGLSVGSDDQKKSFFKSRAYGKFNATIFKMITDKLNEGVIEISKERIEEWLINESSKMSSGQVDDGPNFFIPNYDVFQRVSAKRAAKIGFEVVNMITSKEIEDYYDHPTYPNGPVKAVTYFPAGVLGTTTATNQIDIYSSKAYADWYKHMTRKASMVGYELVNSLASKEDLQQDKEQSVDHAKGDKESQEEYEASLNEAINLPVEVGDTILMGRFKNKKVVVKSIGKDEHGMPTINGKKVVTFRLMKEGFVTELAGTAVQCEKCNHSWDIEEDDSEKYLCHNCGWDSQQQEYDYAAFDSWQEKMGLNEELDEKSKGKLRPADLLRRKAAMAGKKAQIARRRKRTMMRRKPLAKLKKIAYKKAYLQVYDEFMKDLFPGIAKKDLSIQQAKIVHKNVLRKKKRVLKRARFRFLPALRDAEAQKFGKTNEVGVGTGQSGIRMGYPSKDDLKRIEKRVQKQRSNTDSNQEYQYEPIKEQSDKKTQCINNFIEYACKRLKLQGNPKISLMSGTEYADTHKSLGGFNPQTKEIYVATENRLTADICRTLAHELVHRKQDEMGLLKDPIKDGADGSPIENQAHAVAGIIMREYGRIDDTIYQEEINSFYYDDLAKYVYKKRGVINKLFKNLPDEKKAEYLEKLYIKLFQGPTSRMVHRDIKGKGGDLLKMLRKDRRLKEGNELKKLGITDFKSLFKKMPSDLQKRVYNLKNFGQRVDKHPEGNVLKHTITVVNRSIKEDDIDIAIAAMFHDIGKDETAGIHPKKGHITHFGHEKVSAGLVKKYKKWIESVGGNTANVYYIVRNHMKYKQLSVMRPKKADKVKSFRAFDKLGKFSKHDRSGLDESKQLKLRIPNDVKKIHKAFKKNGKKLYVVGGAVRDAILGKSPKDFDVATDAKPDEVEKIAKDNGIPTKLVGKRFGVVIWVINGVEYEVATFRKDIGKGRRPDSVDYTDIHGDVKRRDLTVNALFYDIDRKEIVDLVGGIEDLKKKKIRTVGKAEERFDEDPLRKLRALRFWTRLGGTLDKELLDALQKNPSLKGVSSEAIRDEFLKAIKSSKNTKDFLEMCDKVGFTSQILPNLKVSKPYIKTNDYILLLAWILRKNSPIVLNKILNKINYSNIEKDEIVYLNTLQNFTPEKVLVYKKGQSKADDNRIITFGKMIGKDFKKLIKFKPSVKGGDVPSDINGREIGLWIANKEKENYLKEELITEGGAYGHMSHPFDTDINLTFGQLKDIVNRALEGTLEFTREKTDGQALAISWRDGRLVAARNKGHLKNKGENALDIKGVSDKFQGRGGLSDAYNYAMKDLSNAIKSLSDKQRDKIFKQGACFMNLEVIYPTSVNVIPYGQALLVFHGTMEYNDEGVAIGENGEAARILAGMIKQVNKDVQDNYTIQGPPVVKLPKSQDLSKKRSKYSSKISKLQKEFGLKDTDGVANYHQAWWEQWVDKNSPSTLDNKTKMGLVKRWAFMDKKFRLDKSNISDEKTLEWAKKIDKEDQKKISKQNLMKFEQIFLGLGAEVLEFTSSALTVNPDKAVRDIKKRIDKTIKDVKKSGDPKKIEKLKLELGRLNSIGGSKKIVPNEGIVFLYKGNTFKLTGTFASVNQILGIFF